MNWNKKTMACSLGTLALSLVTTFVSVAQNREQQEKDALQVSSSVASAEVLSVVKKLTSNQTSSGILTINDEKLAELLNKVIIQIDQRAEKLFLDNRLVIIVKEED